MRTLKALLVAFIAFSAAVGALACSPSEGNAGSGTGVSAPQGYIYCTVRAQEVRFGTRFCHYRCVGSYVNLAVRGHQICPRIEQFRLIESP